MSHPLVVDKNVTPYDVDIMRPSKWGNPYPLSWFDSREDCLRSFRYYLLTTNRRVLRDLPELTGKVLGCCCAPRSCHGDVLARMANNKFTLKAYGPR